MKAEMSLMDERGGQSNHLTLIGLLYMVDSVNVGLINIDMLGPARPSFSSSAQLG